MTLGTRCVGNGEGEYLVGRVGQGVQRREDRDKEGVHEDEADNEKVEQFHSD